MILRKYVETSWNGANKKHLIEKGYTFTKIGGKLNVLMEDLKETSPIKVDAECEECGEIFTKQRRDLVENCICQKCNRKKGFNNKKKLCICGKFIERPKDNIFCRECKITQYTKNDYERIDENTVVIILRNSKNEINGYTFIDYKNLEKVMKYKWRIGTGNYIIGGENNVTRLHRYLLNCPNGMDIDHINRITIDNRENNLRVVDRKENCSNRREIGELRYSKIKKNDVANGIGLRVSFWTQGCDFRCAGCHNSCIWDFNGGQPYTRNTIDEVINSISKNNITRDFSILGGEPLHPKNIAVTLDILINVKRKFPNINIWLWTGYLWEDIKDDANISMIIKYIDVLVDGKFEIKNKNLKLKWRGSSNQRVILVPESLKENKIILMDNV